ncbi:MAG: VIT1/CCC1 family protein [Thaumarchaeota archaeon]|nr:VIT1/CCC1 family protein [Nitrososphaerota archaeon]
MATNVSLPRVASQSAKDEYTDYMVYKRLSEGSHNKNPKLKEILTTLSNTEYKHYVFWKKYSPDSKITASTWAIYVTLFLRLIFGYSFAIKYLEKHEATVIRRYKAIKNTIPEADQREFDEMVRDEEEHENTFMDQMQGPYLKYISFIILGLADAIVEISGIHAGSLGIYHSTELTGLAGIVAGAAASIAMASAAYAQAKQGFQGSASVSAIFTGVSYFINAIVLASPYFFTKSQSVAITVSIFLAILIIAFVSYYNSVVSQSHFVRDFAELAGITLGATAALFFFGLLIRSVFGITIG